jgi:hypothetical protein
MLRKRDYPCSHAYRALRDAGYDPKVIRVYGHLKLPSLFNQTPGRRAIKRLTGTLIVPAVVTDSGEVIQECEHIVEWARTHPARSNLTAVGS